MKNMKTAMKLFVSFAIVIVLAIVVGLVGILGMSSINTADDTMYKYNLMAISAMGEIREALQRQRVGLRNYVLDSGDEAKLKEMKNSVDGIEKDMEALFLKYEATITDPSLEEAYFNAKNLYLNEFADIKRQTYESAIQNDGKAYDAIFNDKTTQVTNDMLDFFTLSMRNNEKWGEETVNANTDLFQRMTIFELAALLVAIGLAMFLAFYISSLISKPLILLTSFMNIASSTGDITLRPEDLENINKFAQNKDEVGQCIGSTAAFVEHIVTIADELGSVANGDLTVSIEVLSEKDVMGVAMQKTVDNLNRMFAEIQASTSQVSTGARQISDGSQSLAQGSTEQASAVQELSSSIAEIADKTRINAEMAAKAAQLADTIMKNAEKGSHQMGEMTTAVKDINNASQSINKVIKVIDDIAFQTNILALNAAVEAARAGQHGKGFAVVAEEVRNLAAKSAEAAKDTGSLIANSMEKAELGARIADETASSLTEIVSGINESNMLIAEIARSSEEQSVGITQINSGIEQVAQVVQQNSATAQESAAASQEMNGQAEMLEGLIAQFNLRDDGKNRRGLIGAPESHKAPQKRLSTSESISNEPGGSIIGGFGKY